MELNELDNLTAFPIYAQVNSPLGVQIDMVSNKQELSPVFIVGCGRSGTTILGRTLAEHSQIKYLNEPRHHWIAAYPDTDIWSPLAGSRRGKLVFREHDVTLRQTQTLTALFSSELEQSGRKVLLEKLPINNFRLNFINGMFPGSRYVHIWRNGIEVARSIEQLCEQRKWFGAGEYKWNLLVRYAESNEWTAHLPRLCKTFFHMGLLEWRLSVEAAKAFLEKIPYEQFISVRYASLIDAPLTTINRVLAFLELDAETGISAFAANRIQRSAPFRPYQPTDLEREIGGPLLEDSIYGTSTSSFPDAQHL